MFQPFSWTKSANNSSALHDENDDAKWLDHLIAGASASSSSSSRMDDDGGEGDDNDDDGAEAYVTTTASSSSYFTVLTAQVSKKKQPLESKMNVYVNMCLIMVSSGSYSLHGRSLSCRFTVISTINHPRFHWYKI